MRRRASWLLAGAMVMTCGCASVGMRAGARPAVPLTDDQGRYYAVEPVAESELVTQRRRAGGHSIQRWRLMSGAAEPIEATWFRIEDAKPRPLVLISPTMGSDEWFSRSFARMFAEHQFHAVIVKRPRWRYDPHGPPEQVEAYLRDAVTRNRQVLDWLLRQPGIDATRVGTFGISYGAIINAALAGVEPRTRCHLLALAGGPVADVLATSAERRLRRDWRRTRQIHGLTSRQLRARFRETIRTDPVLLAQHVPTANVLVVIARFDRSVGRENSVRLWRRLGKPRAVFLPAGHYSAVLAWPYLRYQALAFFTKQFAVGPPAGNRGLLYARAGFPPRLPDAIGSPGRGADAAPTRTE